MVILQWCVLPLCIWYTCAWIFSFVLVSLNAFSTLVIQVQSSWYFIIAWLICLLSCKCWPYIRVQQSWNIKASYCTCLFHALLFNASCQYMLLLNLHPLNFGLTPFRWLCSVMLILYFSLEYFWFTPPFLWNAHRMWKKGWVYEFLSCHKCCLHTENGRTCCRSVWCHMRWWPGKNL